MAYNTTRGKLTNIDESVEAEKKANTKNYYPEPNGENFVQKDHTPLRMIIGMSAHAPLRMIIGMSAHTPLRMIMGMSTHTPQRMIIRMSAHTPQRVIIVMSAPIMISLKVPVPFCIAI